MSRGGRHADVIALHLVVLHAAARQRMGHIAPAVPVLLPHAPVLSAGPARALLVAASRRRRQVHHRRAVPVALVAVVVHRGGGRDGRQRALSVGLSASPYDESDREGAHYGAGAGSRRDRSDWRAVIVIVCREAGGLGDGHGGGFVEDEAGVGVGRHSDDIVGITDIGDPGNLKGAAVVVDEEICCLEKPIYI